jgi:hypothetical protein
MESPLDTGLGKSTGKEAGREALGGRESGVRPPQKKPLPLLGLGFVS